MPGCRSWVGILHPWRRLLGRRTQFLPLQPQSLVPQATPVATFTPTPAPVDHSGRCPLTSLIDAAGLDFAERRIIDVYERVAPSVVSIKTQVMRQTSSSNVVPEEGSGSGFVLDKEGHILTNFHVVDGAERIEVTFGD